MGVRKAAERERGRAATTAVIPGRFALSVGKPPLEPPHGWSWVMLTDVARLESGHTPSRREPSYWNGSIPWVGVRDATGNHGRRIATTIQSVTQAGIDNSSARILPPNTVCLSRTASVGYVVAMGVPMATSQDFVNWVCGDRLHWRFLMYVLLAERDALLRYAHGTTHQTIYFPEVKAFWVALPARAEQEAIVATLGALDDKIESNRRIGAKSDEMLQVLAEGVMTHSHWPETTLGNVLETLETGARPRGGVARFTDGVPSIGAESIVRAGVFDFGRTKWIPREYYDNMRKGRLKDRDVLLYKDGGKPGDFRPHVSFIGAGFPFDEAAINEHVFRLRISAPYSQEILYAWLKTDRITDEMRRRATGVAIPGLNSTALRSLPIVQPSPELLDEVNRTIRPLMASVLARARESRTLAALRDALLPKLISGQIRVPLSNDPEEQVGAAVEALT